MEAHTDFWPEVIKCKFFVWIYLFLIKMNYFELKGIVWILEMSMPVFPDTVCVVWRT